MKLQALTLLFVLVTTACASAPQTPAVPPAPPPPMAPPPVPPPPPPPPPPTVASPPAVSVVPAGPANDWPLLDAQLDGVPGTSVDRAYRELLAGRQPARTAIVAVIDGGVDTAHVDLASHLWTHEGETPGNGRDDDGNGYVDDVHGWNFLGGADGRSVHHDTYEVTRLHAQCTAAGPAQEPEERARCAGIATDFEQERTEAEQTLQQIQLIGQMMSGARTVLRQALGTDSITPERVAALRTQRPDVQQARAMFLDFAAANLTPDDLEEAREAYANRLRYGLDPAFDPRPIVGDDYADLSERSYGNADVMGPDAGHGTHVTGIIAAVRGNGIGMDGIANAVRIMTIRAVPDGDERDKDVANAIRYAADNGAHIINMSFGKAYSPAKAIVDEAVRYAEARGVLFIHAAGNDGEDLEQKDNFPNPRFQGGGRAQNWIEVGASTWKSADSLAAPFSNYGRTRVDLFAPGMDVYSTTPGSTWDHEDGTSMAAPMVTGIAALLMAYHPELDAAGVKRILLASASRHPDQLVQPPGGPGTPVPFGMLSVTGGIVNAYQALRMAAAEAGGLD